MKRALLVAVLALLGWAAQASGHGGTAQQGYVSTVSGLTPDVLGLGASVLGGDDRLLLRNWSGKTVVVLGYDGEPYLRFDATGVFRNQRSPAAYLNRHRFAEVELPPQADAKAPPRWMRVSTGPSFAWHDHRIHWMKRTPPPAVQAEPDAIHRIASWQVPASADGTPFTIDGFLGYSPPPPQAPPSGGDGSLPGPAAIAGLVLLLLSLAAIPLALTRRRATRRA